MISRLHEKLGTAGLVVAIVALVAALTGTAIAAGGLSTAEKKEIKKQSKKFSNKFAKKYAEQFSTPGAPGAAGAAGSQGAQGSPGANGANGATGEAGVCSVTTPECTLPSGATLVGAWGAMSGENGNESERELVQISFNLSVSPAPKALTIAKLGTVLVPVELIDGGVNVYGPGGPGSEENVEAFEEVCPGSADAPEADPGYLCIYNGTVEGNPSGPFSFELRPFVEEANEYGLVIPYQMQASESIRGSWAVTAE